MIAVTSLEEHGDTSVNVNTVNLSIFFVYTYGLSFAIFPATLTHVALFHGREIWQQTKATLKDEYADVHTRIMKKNYDVFRQWWFHTILVIVSGLALLPCEGFGRQLQLPYWGVLLAIGLAFIFTLPIEAEVLPPVVAFPVEPPPVPAALLPTKPLPPLATADVSIKPMITTRRRSVLLPLLAATTFISS
ncbi:hypothetical protein DKX38_023344 [Salix brachista]|uniref:Uncharacterized protein n=1 Tax=Salix brachista TaxID=2182728 RepID=A0A5N5JPJ1_9ROSI|nr:hypothetical protein DKX38_023344 [Salix brachista]